MKYTEQQAQEIYRNLFKDGLLREVPSLEEYTPDWSRIDNKNGIAIAIKLSIWHWGGYVRTVGGASPLLFGVFGGTPLIVEVHFGTWPMEPEEMKDFENRAKGWFYSCRSYAEFLTGFTDRFGLTLDENGNLIQ